MSVSYTQPVGELKFVELNGKQADIALKPTQSFMARMKYPLQPSVQAYYNGYVLYGIYRRNRAIGFIAVTVKANGLWFHLLASPITMIKDAEAAESVLGFLTERRNFYNCKYLATAINAENLLGIVAATKFGMKPFEKMSHLEYNFYIYGGHSLEAAQVLRPRHDNTD